MYCSARSRKTVNIRARSQPDLAEQSLDTWFDFSEPWDPPVLEDSPWKVRIDSTKVHDRAGVQTINYYESM